MLEVKIPGTRIGIGYAGEDMDKGTWVVVSGTFSSGDIDTLVAADSRQANAAGFAKEGAQKVMKAVPGQDQTVRPSYPVNKLQMAPEDADSDAIKAGEGVIYYIGGEYETDQYTDVSGTGAAPDDFLKIGDGAKLVEEAGAQTRTDASCAVVVRKTEGIVDGSIKDRVWFRHITPF